MRRDLRSQRAGKKKTATGMLRMEKTWKLGTFALAVLAFASVEAQAQVASAPASAAIVPPAVRGFAGASFQTPLAFGASWGGVGVGVYGQTIDGTAADADDDYDGALGLAVGFGDADEYVGLETQVSVASITGANDSSFGENGSFGFKLHTNLPGDAAFAIGAVGLEPWGQADDRLPNGDRVVESSVYAVASKVFALGNNPLVLSLGLGDEVFQDPNEDGANVMGSAAFYFTRQISVIAEYTGRFANAAVSAAPFSTWPLTVSLGLVNIAEEHNSDMEVAGSIAMGFDLR